MNWQSYHAERNILPEVILQIVGSLLLHAAFEPYLTIMEERSSIKVAVHLSIALPSGGKHPVWLQIIARVIEDIYQP